MKYKASLDALTKILTLTIIFLYMIIGSISVQALIGAQGDTSVIWRQSLLLVVFTSTLITCYLFAPTAYIIDDNGLTIKRLIKDRIIKYADITGIWLIPDSEMGLGIRYFGSGGLFGYFGKFYNTKLGRYTAYATQQKNRVLIQTNNGKIVITPDDVDIVHEITQRIPSKQ